MMIVKPVQHLCLNHMDCDNFFIMMMKLKISSVEFGIACV